jgi:hypothetical protein
VRAGSGGAEEPIRARVAPTGSLNGMRRSGKAEVPERSVWRIHCGVEVTELSTNQQHTL